VCRQAPWGNRGSQIADFNCVKSAPSEGLRRSCTNSLNMAASKGKVVCARHEGVGKSVIYLHSFLSSALEMCVCVCDRFHTTAPSLPANRYWCPLNGGWLSPRQSGRFEQKTNLVQYLSQKISCDFSDVQPVVMLLNELSRYLE
jgi:hypothetical protein